MSKPMLVGITGGIGSGKSTVCKIFEVLGVPVYYADDRGKALLTEDEVLIQQVKKEFGNESYSSKGVLNRQYLAQEVFSNSSRLEKLNALVHPAVAEDFKDWVALNSKSRYVLKEAALLYEIGPYKQLDATICVMASESIRKQRVLLRDQERTMEQIQQIMNKQTDDSTRKKLSDYIVKNDSKRLLIPQVNEIHQAILRSTSN